MRPVLLLLLCSSFIQNRRRHRLQPKPQRRISVLELDFKTPKLGFLPFSEDNRMIWDLDAVYKYSNYYYRNLCLDGCPIDTMCQWGVCVCTNDLLLYKGRCQTRAHVYHQSRSRSHVSSANNSPRGQVSISGSGECDQSQSCQGGDINQLCVGTSETTSGTCSCRDDMRVNQWTSQCELYIDVDCRNLQDLFESQKHEYYSRQRQFWTDNFTKRNASIPHTLAGTYLSKIEPLSITHEKIRHYFCTDVVDVLTLFKEPSLEDQAQILAWRQQYSSSGMQTGNFYALAPLFMLFCLCIEKLILN